MPRINFRMGYQYEIGWRGKLRYGDVSEQRLAERFTDGRNDIVKVWVIRGVNN